ncbi:hypothetical protein EDC04DRAFT_2597793 [Pisolithus marmoratus]|nr:hypothetical protein EDC04DRAFT_2597793 [Pisolithus marmoratus]
MAKGNTRKGVTMIGPSPGHQVKQLEVRTQKANGWHRSQLVEVATKEPAMTTPACSFPSSSLSKHSMSLSKHYFQSDDGVDNTFDMNDPPVEPMRLSQKKAQNDYICEWLPQKEDFLHILLELEAPPLPRICKIMQEANPFHRIQQWTGDFFEDSALHMSGLQLHLGHGGAPCPSASVNEQETSCSTMGPGFLDNARHNVQDTAIDSLAMDEVEWEDINNIPLHLRPPLGSKYLTIVNVTGVHFMLLCPSTFTRPSTMFTFAVLDDFLRDNVECGTSGRNYYNKLHQMTSSVFPHLVAVAWQWQVLKLLKWSGFHDKTHWLTEGDLVLFCMACPQPGINVSPMADLDQLTFQSWKYTRTLVMDGNFKAEHMHERRPDDQVWLMDGHSFTVTNLQYQEYLKATPHITEKSTCNNHKAISQASMSWGKLNSTGIPPTLTIVAGIGTWHVHGHRKECYARYSLLFIKGSGWVDGEIIKTLWSTLNIVSASTHGMMPPHQQELLDFQMNDSNFMKMIWMRLTNLCKVNSLSQKLKAVWASVVLARESFDRLDAAVTPAQQMIWKKQEEATLNEHIHDPLVMDTFEMQLKRVHAMELDLLEKSKQLGIDHGTASCITRGLQIEEAEIILTIQTQAQHEDRLTAEWTRFITDGRIYLRMAHPLEQELTFDGTDAVVATDMLGEEETFSNGGDSNGGVDNILDMETPIGQTPSFLPLPSKFGMDECQSMGVHQLVDMELKLHMGQANDALHGLHLALADKAVIFKSVCWDSMIWLGASRDILDHYQELINSDLATSTVAFTQGAHYHCTSQLPWFWTIDIPRDTNSKSWLTEFYHIHWLCTKAGKDHWEEEEELLMSEFQWVTHYFKYHARCWNERYKEMQVARVHGAACYAARQQAVYDWLAEQAELKWQEMNLKN